MRDSKISEFEITKNFIGIKEVKIEVKKGFHSRTKSEFLTGST